MPTIFAFNNIENKHTLYYGEVWTKIFCESLRGHAKRETDFEKKKKVTVSKRITKTKLRCKSMLYL